MMNVFLNGVQTDTLSGIIDVDIDQIVNETQFRTGSLRYELWVSQTPFGGDYNLVGKKLYQERDFRDNLDPGETWNFFSFSTDISSRDQKKFKSVVLTEFRDTPENDGFVPLAHVTFGTSKADVMRGGDWKDGFSAEAGNDRLYGGKNDDNLDGDSGNDRLFGQAGDDFLLGQTGKDRLSGGPGSDLLVGGSGKDVLMGGSGSDEFRFEVIGDSPRGRSDKIKDFSRKQNDLIDLSEIDANGLLFGNQSFEFIGKRSFSGQGQFGAGELRFSDKPGQKVIVQADVDGDGRADLAISVIGVNRVSEGDFIL